jgi:hypothetical protein
MYQEVMCIWGGGARTFAKSVLCVRVEHVNALHDIMRIALSPHRPNDSQ